jgi:hypothetical protein
MIQDFDNYVLLLYRDYENEMFFMNFDFEHNTITKNSAVGLY